MLPASPRQHALLPGSFQDQLSFQAARASLITLSNSGPVVSRRTCTLLFAHFQGRDNTRRRAGGSATSEGARPIRPTGGGRAGDANPEEGLAQQVIERREVACERSRYYRPFMAERSTHMWLLAGHSDTLYYMCSSVLSGRTFGRSGGASMAVRKSL